MRIREYTEYFRNIAESFSLINSFYEADMFDFETFADNLRGENPASMVLVLEAYTRVQQPVSTANVDVLRGAIVVLDRIDARTTRQLLQLADAEIALLEIRKRMFLDSHYQGGTAMVGLQESTKIDPAILVANEWAGYRMEFSIEVESPREVVALQWPNYNPYVR